VHRASLPDVLHCIWQMKGMIFTTAFHSPPPLFHDVC